MQEINALKTLEHPAHRRTIGWFVDLIGDGLLCCHQLATKQQLSQAVHQQTEDHDEAEAQSRALAS
jgi:predicted metal-dependent phosphoesterase TrpH